jgi:hypothetical protein
MNWTPAEIDEVLDAVTASSIVRGRKKALEELNRARAKIATKANPRARATIRFGERPAALIAEVLQGRSSPAARSALRQLEEAALHAVRGAWGHAPPPRSDRRPPQRARYLRLDNGNPTGALAAAEQAIALDPYNEAAHQVAMHAESVLGLWQAIVGRYERLCQELDTRFGLEPEHETRVLYRRLLSQDGREALRHLSPAPASPEGVRRY